MTLVKEILRSYDSNLPEIILCLSARDGKPAVADKTMGTLTSKQQKSVHSSLLRVPLELYAEATPVESS